MRRDLSDEPCLGQQTKWSKKKAILTPGQCVFVLPSEELACFPQAVSAADSYWQASRWSQLALPTTVSPSCLELHNRPCVEGGAWLRVKCNTGSTAWICYSILQIWVNKTQDTVFSTCWVPTMCQLLCWGLKTLAQDEGWSSCSQSKEERSGMSQCSPCCVRRKDRCLKARWGLWNLGPGQLYSQIFQYQHLFDTRLSYMLSHPKIEFWEVSCLPFRWPCCHLPIFRTQGYARHTSKLVGARPQQLKSLSNSLSV